MPAVSIMSWPSRSRLIVRRAVGFLLVVLSLPISTGSSYGAGKYRLPGHQDRLAGPNRALDADQYGVLSAPPKPGSGLLAVDGHFDAAHQALAESAGEWRFLGPAGGTVSTLAASPAIHGLVLAGLTTDASPAFYRSVDSGETWSEVSLESTGIPGIGPVHDVEFTPEGTPYVVTSYGLLRGSVNAESWTPLPVPSAYYSRVAFQPGNSGEIWLGCDRYNSPGIGLLRSRDGGMTWQNITPPLVNTTTVCTGIAFDSARPETVLVCFGELYKSGDVWRTFDGGATWMRSKPLTNNPMTDVVYDGSRFLLSGGDSYQSQFAGLYSSSTAGAPWSSLHTAAWPTRVIRDVELDRNHPGTILAATARGLFRSTDNGVTWSFGVGGTGALPLQSVITVAGEPDRLILGTDDQGVFTSSDGGASFRNISSVRAVNVVGIAANPLNPLELAATFADRNSGGIVTTLDGGRTWQVERALPTCRFGAPEFGPDGMLYAASNGPSNIPGPEGVYRRETNGSWSGLGPDQGPAYETDIRIIRVSPTNPDVILAGGSNWFTDRAIIVRSANRGITWTQVYTSAAQAVRVTDIEFVADGSGTTLLAAHTGAGAVLRSSDGGNNWTQLPTGIPAGTYSTSDLCAASNDPHTFYFGSSAGQGYLTADGGATWTPMGATGRFYSLACDPARHNVIYGVGRSPTNSSSMIWRSTDGGNSFSPFDAGLGNYYPYVLAVRAGSCASLLLATNQGVMERSIDSTTPEISVVLDRERLWPPNHRMEVVHAEVTVSDDCDETPTFALTSIEIDDAMETGGGDTPVDVIAATGTPATEFSLRAERTASGSGRSYLVTYSATDASGNSTEVTVSVTVPHDVSALQGSVLVTPEAPRPIVLAASPNPFHAATSATFTLNRAQRVILDVYDLRGARVRRLVSEELAAGDHRVSWDGDDEAGGQVASGMYVLRLLTDEGRQNLKVAYLK